jgi:Ca2+-binding EF-hand superfamily protein
MKPKTRCLTFAALSLLLAAAVTAGAQPRKPDAEELTKRFTAADKNGDGRLTLAEAKAGMPRLVKNFESIDRDKKGYITLDELKAAVAAGGSQ